MSKTRPLKGLANSAKGTVAKGAKKVLPKAKKLRQQHATPDIPRKPPAPKPQATDQKLKNYIENLWHGHNSPNRTGDGTTFDALRNEIRTGRLTGGKGHFEKAAQTQRDLRRWLDGPGKNASPADRQIAEDLLKRFEEAWKG